MAKRRMPVSEAKAQFADIVQRAQRQVRTVLTRHGDAVAAVVPIEDLARLEAYERSDPRRGLAGLIGKVEPSDELVNDALAVRERSRKELDRPPPELDAP